MFVGAVNLAQATQATQALPVSPASAAASHAPHPLLLVSPTHRSPPPPHTPVPLMYILWTRLLVTSMLLLPQLLMCSVITAK